MKTITVNESVIRAAAKEVGVELTPNQTHFVKTLLETVENDKSLYSIAYRPCNALTMAVEVFQRAIENQRHEKMCQQIPYEEIHPNYMEELAHLSATTLHSPCEWWPKEYDQWSPDPSKPIKIHPNHSEEQNAEMSDRKK